MKTTLEEHQAFVTVVDAGTITAAAERLGQTVSGVSRALKRLERKLGANLLQRSTRRLSLTEEGRLFLDEARRVLETVAQAEQTIQLHRGTPAGQLRINAAPVFMKYVIVPLVAAFRTRYPRIELRLDTHDRIIDLLEYQTDVAIRIGPLTDSTLYARLLGRTELRLVAAPEYLTTRGTPTDVQTLAGHTLLGYDAMTHLNRWPVANHSGDDLHIEPDLAASSASTLLELALAGNGIACLADYTTRDHFNNGELREVLPRQRLPRQQSINAVYYQNAAPAARVRLFLDFLADRLPALV